MIIEPDAMYHISPTGSDSASGGSAHPWRTLHRAASVVQPGDTVFVHAGVYDDRRVVLRVSGTAQSPIRFIAQSGAEIPGFLLLGDYIHISGFTIRFFQSALQEDSPYGIEIRGSRFVLEDNRFIETLGAGVFTSPGSANGIIRRNFFHRNVLSCLEIHGTAHLVEANIIRQPIQDHPSGRKTDDADAIRFFGTGHIFRRNDIRQVWYGADTRDAHMDCFQTFRGAEEGDPELTTDILIEDNYCEASSYQTEDECGCGITLEKVGSTDGTFERGIVIRNNLIIAPYASGIHGAASHVSFLNNTCLCHPDFTQYNTYGLDYWHPDCRLLNIQNNRFVNYTHPFYISKPAWQNSLLSGDFPPPVIYFYSHRERANLTEIGMTAPPAESTLGANLARISPDLEPASVFSDIPAAPSLSPARLSPWVKRIYFANFETSLQGWRTHGDVTISDNIPNVDGRAVCLQGDARLEMDGIQVITTRHANIILRFLLGADALDEGESLQLFWRATDEWRSLPFSPPPADGQLHEMILPLPSAAEEQPCLQIALRLQAAPFKQAWLDNLELLGEPKYRKRHKTFLPFLTA